MGGRKGYFLHGVQHAAEQKQRRAQLNQRLGLITFTKTNGGGGGGVDDLVAVAKEEVLEQNVLKIVVHAGDLDVEHVMKK